MRGPTRKYVRIHTTKRISVKSLNRPTMFLNTSENSDIYKLSQAFQCHNERPRKKNTQINVRVCCACNLA